MNVPTRQMIALSICAMASGLTLAACSKDASHAEPNPTASADDNPTASADDNPTASADDNPTASADDKPAALTASARVTPKPFSHTVAEGHEVAVLAGGCFWGMEELIRDIDGVIDTEVGYTGGSLERPTYQDLVGGSSGHAEAVRIVFDPKRLSFEDLLLKWFFRMHDPTTLNRQGNDTGDQYRSAIFVTSPEQRPIAERAKKRVDDSGAWKAPVVTEITEAGAFTPAETYHQDYLQKKPDGYTCHFIRPDLSF